MAVLKLGVVGSGREKTPLSRLRKEVIILSDSTRTPLQIQCAFNGFCKKVLKREAINAHRDAKRYRKHYVCFSDLTFKELNQLHTIQMQMSNENRGKYILAGGKKITPELLYKAIEALPEDKQNTIELYYFCNMSDASIAKRYHIPRSTAQYSRKCILKILRQYLEEHADEGSE